MVFDAIVGQDPAVRVLKNALQRQRVHHAYRFEGPEGVGKELTAFALAQSLVCTAGGDVGCGQCSACHRAVTLADEEPHVPLHPDVVLVGRGVYPKSLVGKKETSGISVEQIRRVVLSRASFSPHEARGLIFIVRDAEELTQSAANALLKTLEEPHDRVHFILLTSRPHRLLDTILSRSLAVRFGPLPERVVADILAGRGLDGSLAALSHGSMREALELADAERRAETQRFAHAVRSAIESHDLRAALDVASSLPSDKQQVRAQLAAFGELVALDGRRLAATNASTAALRAREYAIVQQTLGALERNASPTLSVEAMLIELRATARTSAYL